MARSLAYSQTAFATVFPHSRCLEGRGRCSGKLGSVGLGRNIWSIVVDVGFLVSWLLPPLIDL
jgi:hypothetical protein